VIVTAHKIKEFHPKATAGSQKGLVTLRFGEFLFQQDLITEEQLLQALADHWSNGGNIGSAINRQGFLSEFQIEEQAHAYHALELVEVS